MKKTKTSKVKKINKQSTKLRRQGKLKLRRHKKTVVKSKNVPPPQVVHKDEEEETESDHGEDLRQMIEPEDLEFIKSSIIEGSYSLFKGKNFTRERKLLKRKAETQAEEESLENKYEKLYNENAPKKKVRYLLPIKTKDGVIRRTIEEEDKSNDLDEPRDVLDIKPEEPKSDEDDDDDDESDFLVNDKKDLSKPISVAEMLVWREKAIAQYKYKIGLLASSLLENTQQKILNITRLLEIYDEWHPELQVTLKKLVAISLLEVFRDILPSYQIKHQDNPNVKLKKDTRELQNFEKSLLKGYREYLNRLEKLVSKLFKKKGDTRMRSKQEISLGELGIKCLCELLIAHPYFNYTKNIVRLITPYLNSNFTVVRQNVYNAFRKTFICDKRGEITLEIVKRINDLVKKKHHAVKPEVISVLSNLRIQDINLDKIKEDEQKEKKLMAKKSRVINLSKKERKRQKRIAEVEKELLETKAEENKQARNSLLTEVTKLVFTIYFRILKSAPSSGLLSAALQGLAKFAHCINLEYYEDLVRLLDKLMTDGNLKTKEQLNCILTVFKILSGQGEALCIDPNKFYSHLYANMFNVDLGKRSSNCELLLECLDQVILGRRKKLSNSRTLAFVKRLGSLALQQEHHMALACLTIIKQMLQLNTSVNAMLDVDTSIGQGVYLPELQDPEYCNAARTALYELNLLQRHYHPTVRQMATYLVNNVPATGKYSMAPEILKMTSSEIFSYYNPSEVVFRPSIPPPTIKETAIKFRGIEDKNLVQKCNNMLHKEICVNFSELLDLKP
ncbi:nucleolar complex protein 3 isoform X2 [Rhodnius prolixus]|uniref:nucleolar complex protein 3 isoform X2 n=1 Tax=Rhodnius prolixus TaxID=13249 RepID=UPI003D187965